MTNVELAELDKQVAKLCDHWTSQLQDRLPESSGAIIAPPYSTNWNTCMKAIETFYDKCTDSQRCTFETNAPIYQMWGGKGPDFLLKLCEAGPAAVCRALVAAWKETE